MSLHYLVKYLCSKNHCAPEVIEANCILSRLNYCNSLLSRLPMSNIQPLQRVMNAAAWVIMNLSLRERPCEASSEAATLAAGWAKNYILAVSVHYITSTLNRLSTVSALGGWYRLRSTGSADYVLPRTRTRFGERGYSYCGPAVWNTLPSDLHDITDIQKTTQECTLWSCLPLTTVGAPGRVV